MNTNQYGQPIGFPLPDWQPVALPPRGTLVGQYCRLVPTTRAHDAALFAAYSLAADDRDWTWLGADRPATLAEMTRWIEAKIDVSGQIPWTVIDAITDRPVGLVCYSCIDTDNGALEIGHVTWSALMQRTPVGTEALFLLMQHAFSSGYRRIAWRCDSLNSASRRAAERMGFSFEGCFRQAMARKQRNRDTDWLSVIDSEWPAIAQAVSGWLAADNFTADGGQLHKLSHFFQR